MAGHHSFVASNGQSLFTQYSNSQPGHVESVAKLAHQNSNNMSGLDDDEDTNEHFADAQEHIRNLHGSTNDSFLHAGQMYNDRDLSRTFQQAEYIDTRHNFTPEKRQQLRRTFENIGADNHNSRSTIAPCYTENNGIGFVQGSSPNAVSTPVHNPRSITASPQTKDEDVGMEDVNLQSVADYTCDEPYKPDGFTRGASTPPPEASQNLGTLAVEPSRCRAGPVVDDPNYPHPVKNLSPRLVTHNKLHARCLPLKPSLSLAEHRYWIAVLPHTRRVENLKEEKHLIWMRGNRFTTVRTVWHYYQQASMALEEIVLLHAEIRVGDDIMVQELDLWDDKFVVFHAVDAKSKEAKGKDLSAGLLVDIVVID